MGEYIKDNEQLHKRGRSEFCGDTRKCSPTLRKNSTEM
ncbi:hypothetical protein ADU37_CDS13930 [Thermococcus sp. 2319x1]|nr:hypothetical protein ADU37_CDS13930 [Thermococcus sp. 2319x1]